MTGLLLLLTLQAVAGTSPLRAPTPSVVVVEVGTPEVSVGAWLDSSWGAYASARMDLGSAEAGVARRVRLAGEDTGWRLEAGLGAGVLVPMARPGVALALTPSLTGGVHGEKGGWVGGLVLPAVVGTGGVRLPALLETSFGRTFGSLWLGARLATGGTLTVGQTPSFAAEAGLVVGFKPRD